METPTEKQIQDTSNAAAMYAMEVKRIREQLTDLIEAHAKLKDFAFSMRSAIHHLGIEGGCIPEFDLAYPECRADFPREEQK